MYTVSFADASPDSLAIPPMQLDPGDVHSAWKNHDGFVAHTRNRCIRNFLKKYGDLFVQAVPARRCIRN